MDVTQQLIMTLYEELQSTITKHIEMDSFIKEYHDYRKIWTPENEEKQDLQKLWFTCSGQKSMITVKL